MNTSDAVENITAPKNLSREAANSKSLNRTTLITEQPEGRQLNSEKIDLVNSPEFTAVLLPVFLVIAAGALVVFQLLHKKDQKVASNLLSHFNQVPCMNCHFLCMNPYLKCAVNPVAVLTKEAIDCPDYRPRNGIHLH